MHVGKENQGKLDLKNIISAENCEVRLQNENHNEELVDVDRVANIARMNEVNSGLSDSKGESLIDAEDDRKDAESHASERTLKSSESEHRGDKQLLENGEKDRTESVDDGESMDGKEGEENIPTCEMEETESLADGGNMAEEKEGGKEDGDREIQNTMEGQWDDDDNVNFSGKFEKFEGSCNTQSEKITEMQASEEKIEEKIEATSNSGEEVNGEREKSVDSEIHYLPKNEDREYAEKEHQQTVSHLGKPLKSASTKAELLNMGSRKYKKTTVNPPPPKSITTVSSIDINISRIIHGDSETDVGNTVAMVTTKSVDFSIHTGVDEVEQELARVVGCDDGVSTFSDFPGGRAAATNTPVERYLQHRGLHTPVRDNIYEHALHLIKNRCTSQSNSFASRYHLQYPSGVSELLADEESKDPFDMVSLPTLLSKIHEPAVINQPNRTFYVAQQHPIPLEPLKVWKGYHGNVFFQPMVCRKMKMAIPDKVPINAVHSSARKAYSSPSLQGNGSRFPNVNSTQRNRRALTAKTWNGRSNVSFVNDRNVVSAAYRPGTRQMSVLDRKTVLSQIDQHFGEDITWINGTEALGALQVGTGMSRSSAHFYDNREQHHKLRIRRGLVSHNKASSLVGKPALDVSGGKIKDRSQGLSRTNTDKVYPSRASSSKSIDLRYFNNIRYDRQQNLNEKRVMVDLTTGSEIVKEYLTKGDSVRLSGNHKTFIK